MAKIKINESDVTKSLVATNAQVLGLTLDPAWLEGIRDHFQNVLRHAAFIEEFPLPDDAEPAPVFHA